jgi:sterol desaturase/sphingolipid hydroxylase (fatty acid hydroxylase superfamily)
MLDLGNILENIWGSFANVAAPESDLYWLYLVSATGLVFIIYWLRRYGHEDVSFRGFLAFCFPKRIYAHPSAQLDFKYLAINTVLYGAFIAPLLLTSTAAAYGTVAILVALFGMPETPLLTGGVWANLGVTVAAVVVADIGFFVAHNLQHRIPLLWEFHKVHHAAEVLHPVALYRRHPVDTALDVTLMGAGAGAVLGFSAYIFGESVEGVNILGTNAVLFLFHFAGANLRHSHVRLSYGPFLDRILISPTLHQTHHGCAPQHVDKNFGGILSIWDWLAGTLYIPRDDEELTLGLPNGEHRDYNSVVGLYLLPFAKNAQRLRRRFRQALIKREMPRRRGG